MHLRRHSRRHGSSTTADGVFALFVWLFCLTVPAPWLPPSLPVADIFIEGITFATWFGGSDQTWAPPTDTYTMFRNMKAYYMGPTDTPGRSAVVNRYKGPQVVVNEFIDEGV